MIRSGLLCLYLFLVPFLDSFPSVFSCVCVCVQHTCFFSFIISPLLLVYFLKKERKRVVWMGGEVKGKGDML